MTRLAIVFSLSITFLTSCSMATSPVRVYGSPADLERLSGEWSGQYFGNAEHRREGSIWFRLSGATHEAVGDVLMTPAGGERYERYDGTPTATQSGMPRNGSMPAPKPLTIRFVNVDGGALEGSLDRYWDPDRQTTAVASFSGHLRGNVIEGTFKTTYDSGEPYTTGRWRVERQRR